MKRLGIVLSLLLFLGGSAALAQRVNVDHDRSANFQQFKTYAWATGTPIQNSIWDQRIRDGIDQRLAARGFQKVQPGHEPDLFVLYHGATTSQVQMNTNTMGGWGWRWGGSGMARTTVDQIPIGQLTVDIGDARTQRLLWMGSASDTLSDNPSRNERQLNRALDRMFRNFPPRP